MQRQTDIQIIKTRDGSHTLLVPELEETYHSTHGAKTESEYVFIEKGLKPLDEISGPIKIWEVGFGTGLNALLVARQSWDDQRPVEYHSIESHPINSDFVSKLNYPDSDNESDWFHAIHEQPWKTRAEIHPYFHLVKQQEDWAEFKSELDFHIIFYDAFAPSKQPEMWSYKLLEKSYQMLSDKGVLVTYCAQGQFKRDLKSIGFMVETLPGPPGKAEMVRAIKS